MNDSANPSTSVRLSTRPVPAKAARALQDAGFDQVLARLFAARGVEDAREISADVKDLLKPDGLMGLSRAADTLAQAVLNQEPCCVVGDYDCDGATATAVMVAGLKKLGAKVDYLVPNRFTDGYGLSPNVVQAACQHPRLGKPRWLITVDNGIASIAGAESARENQIGVIITDHHLPGDQLPRVQAIVNPNQNGCEFPSRHLAGVGVAFYVLAAVRAALRRAGQPDQALPPLVNLLDLVALGTIADLVPLDANNRRLVGAGLARIKAGKACAGINALLQVAGVAVHQTSVRDLGFALGPRINAAGRLDDISMGIECLLAQSEASALAIAEQLDAINRQRREIETDMRESALTTIETPDPTQMSLVLFQPDWHEGVVGLVAGRLKDRFFRPTFAFAPAAGEPGRLRGSGRSIAGIHLRDALALVDARHPGLIDRFGGHAMAAGLSLPETGLADFESAIEQAIADIASPEAMNAEVKTDGSLTASDLKLSLVHAIDQHIWGQGFPAPVFCNQFRVLRQRIVGSGHLKLDLALDGREIPAIYFQRREPLAEHPWLAYTVQANEYRGRTELQLLIQAVGQPG